MKNNTHIIYGSGDAGSIELKTQFALKHIPYQFYDIRTDRKYLVHLLNLKLNSVPQVFNEDGSYLGDYEGAAKWVALQPDPERVPMMA